MKFAAVAMMTPWALEPSILALAAPGIRNRHRADVTRFSYQIGDNPMLFAQLNRFHVQSVLATSCRGRIRLVHDSARKDDCRRASLARSIWHLANGRRPKNDPWPQL